MFAGMRRLPVLLALLALAAVPSAARAGDFSYNILPPGQFGGLPGTAANHGTDQIPLYDALTPLRGNVGVADILKHYKPESLAPIGASTVEPTTRPGNDLTIRRDSFDVPHIYGKTRSATWWGAGWVTAEDRELLASLGRLPAYAAVADVPGLNAFGLVTSGGGFTPSAQARAFVHGQQRKLVERYGAKGRQILSDLQDYSDGITAYRRSKDPTADAWTIDDCIAVTAFIGSIFGNGGGNEVGNSDFLARLRGKLGARQGAEAFGDLMEANDPEAPTTTSRRFRYGHSGDRPTKGSLLVDEGSAQKLDLTAAAAQRRLASNFLVVSAKRSATGEPLAVMGPQLGYYDPEIVIEADLHGPGIDAQGALTPGGSPYVLIGRTKNYAWSLTTATSDNTDQFLERLCGKGGRSSDRYLYKGKCIRMRTFDAGTLKNADTKGATKALRYHVTVHGPVQGTVMVKGRPYAIAKARSTYGQDALGIAALRDMTLGKGSTVRGFYKAANEFGFTFNWAYASRRHVAYFSSGKLPIRAKGTNKLLPTLGTGKYDWKGFLPLSRHPHVADPKGGLLLNWNNKPAPGWEAGEDNLSYGSVHRVEAFDHFPKKVRIQDVVSIMNRAATEDVTATQVWPVIHDVLATGKAPNGQAKLADQLVTGWARRGASRLDADLDGKIDDPGAAILDVAFTKLATAALGARLGSLTGNLADLMAPDANPQGRNGSSFGSGWYGYVDKDLRTLLKRKVRGQFALSYCGRGSLSRCRSELWRALDAADKELAAKQGSDPRAWRADATKERIKFTPGLIPDTMRWTNRSTFQQVLRFGAKP
jgi:acyl-homoserine lactone acylase PvdQ